MPANHRTRGICTYPDCGKPHFAKQFCKGHYTQLIRGRELRPLLLTDPRELCTFPGCGRPHHSRGLCDAHAMQSRRGRVLHPIGQKPATLPKVCIFDGCGRPVEATGLCRAHYQQARRGTVLKPVRKVAPRGTQVGCSVPGCDRDHHAKGLCAAHVHQVQRGQRLRPLGEPSRTPRKPVKKSVKLPAGWDRPLPARKPAAGKGMTRVMVVNPTNPLTMAAALAVLRDAGAEDVAEALGLTRDGFRAEVERWALWQGAAA